MDTPQQQLRSIILPADPSPIKQPRPEQYSVAETDYRVVAGPPVIDPITGIPRPGATKIVTEDGTYRTTQPIGVPDDIDLNAVQPQYQRQHYGPAIAVVSATGDGQYTIMVTCSSAHGLSTDGQIIAAGMADAQADGAYSVVVVTPMAFRYTTNKTIPSGSLLTGSSRIWTTRIGLPLGYSEIPQTGI